MRNCPHMTFEHAFVAIILTISCYRRAQPIMGGTIPRQVSSFVEGSQKSV